LNNSDINIFNIYIPPASGCPRGYNTDLSPVLNSNNDILVIGNVNAHHPSWDSALLDARGEVIALAIDLSPFLVLNEDTATRIPVASNQPASSPDISLASAHLALEMTWSTHLTLNSNHLLITLALASSQPSQHQEAKTFTNFRKADYPRFIREVESDLRGRPLPTSFATGERVFREALLRAAKHLILKGCRKKYELGLTCEMAHKIDERDVLRGVNPQDPEITRLNHEIADDITKNRKRIWRETV
jgi:hypothetical protein